MNIGGGQQFALQPVKLIVSNPEWAGEKAFDSPLELSYDEINRERDKILSTLINAGMNMGLSLFILGIPATKPGKLSPSDIAKLVRFIQITRPEALKLLATTLTKLICTRQQKAEHTKLVKKAA